MRALCLAMILALGGCGLTPQGSGISDTLKTKGADVYDEGLANAEFFICRAASVGSVMRRYGSSADLARAWKTLCTSNPDAIDGLFGIKRAPEGEG